MKSPSQQVTGSTLELKWPHLRSTAVIVRNVLAKGVQNMAIVNVQYVVLDMLAETKTTPTGAQHCQKQVRDAGTEHSDV